MAVQATEYTCYSCNAQYLTNKHSCERECHVEGKGVKHYDWCQKCRRLIIGNLETQMRLKELPPKRLRIE